uniref:Dematin actin binding protein n=1 Tax=Bos mutus grunniens TaxID=30521 RepID=A0A8B9WZH5_BOSMU
MERLQKAKMDNQVLGYKDLAAIPKDKAILDIERPDLMIYEPHFTYSLLEHVELPRSRERSLSPKSTSPPPSPEVWAESRSPGTISQASAPRTAGTPRTSLPHFHHPETTRPDSNIYKKPPIYKQRAESTGGSPQSKHPIEDLIIESSKFPAAQPPDPNQPAKIETDYWPCPPSLAVVETEWRKRKASRRGAEEEEEEEDDDSGEEMKALRERQREELSKVTSNLGKMILKEEMEKSLPIRRKTRSLPDRTPFHTSLHAGTSKSSSLPAYGRTTLSRVRSQHRTHRLLGKSGHVGPVRDGVLGQAGQRAGGEREQCSTLPSPLILLCPLQLQSTDFSPSGSEAESPGERQG